MSAEKLPFTDADERIFNDPAPIAVTKGDWTTSDEAMAFLREHGVEAWQAWVAQQRAGGT